MYKGKLLGLGSSARLARGRSSHRPVQSKAAVAWNRVFETQALTCLRLSGLELALVVNFGEAKVKNGIHRVVNGLQE